MQQAGRLEEFRLFGSPIRLFIGLTFCLANMACFAGHARPSETERVVSMLFNVMEQIEAQGEEIRNRNKKVSWNDWKSHILAQIGSGEQPRNLQNTLELIEDGFINSHSFIRSSSHVPRPTQRARYLNVELSTPSLDFYFSSPHLRRQKVTHVNRVPILELVDDYVNYRCDLAFIVSCNFQLAERLEFGIFPRPNGDDPIQSFNGKPWINRRPIDSYTVEDNCVSFKRNTAWTMLFDDDAVCLFRREDVLLLRIRHFQSKMSSSVDDIYCLSNHAESSMCSSVNQFQSAIEKLGVTSAMRLVVDLQGNRGGGENTAWVAALVHKGFTDNPIRYRCNREMLSDPKVRSSIFYGSDRAESWFNEVLTHDQRSCFGVTFLPVRADFCRADARCQLRTMLPKSSTPQFSSITLVVDEDCASSCDDFVVRLKRFGDATVVGVPPRSDSTYARVRGAIGYSSNGKLDYQLYPTANSTDSTFRPIVDFQLPVSRTTDSSGDLVDGKSPLDLLLPLPVEQYHRRREYRLEQATTGAPTRQPAGRPRAP